MTTDKIAGTSATVLTSSAPAAVAVVAVWGKSAEAAVLQNWTSATAQRTLRANRIYYGIWRGATSGTERAGEDVVICKTSVDVIEIHCHGGAIPSSTILSDLQSSGVHLAKPTEFQEHVASDPLCLAAWQDLQHATSPKAIQILLHQARGVLSQAFRKLQSAKALQAPDWKANAELLLQRGSVGCRLLAPPEVAIVGPPNAGKSTLLNCLLGWDRAIVDATPGTTRDVLREALSLDGWPLYILDTAGLRRTHDEIEQAGIVRATKSSMSADVILLLVDGTVGWTDLHSQIYSAHARKTILVHTKADLTTTPRASLPFVGDVQDAVEISSLTQHGIETLIQRLLDKIGFTDQLLKVAVPFRSAHLDQLRQLLLDAK